MIRLAAQRIALGLLTLFLVSVLIFAGTEILPGDVATAVLGQSATPDAVEAIRRSLGLHDPAVVRYLNWLARLPDRRCRHVARRPAGRSDRTCGCD